ncbi:MAG: hypothetical protein IJE43_05850 [Alphaproteobacteria bacterium]|nr:hypothetical protein [Alphaproteobacteria bacterium]
MKEKKSTDNLLIDNIEVRRVWRDNAMSVLRKMAIGSLAIVVIGICAYIFLVILMILA